MSEELLSIRDLHVSYRTRGGVVPAVRGVSLDVAPGEVVAVVGESGSGKSTTAHSVLRLLAANGSIDSGAISFAGQDLLALSEGELRAVRGAQIGLVPQDPTVSLNPVTRVGEQVAEVLRMHGLSTRRGAPIDALEVLDRAGLPEPAVRARQYPHELSGGMRQRVLIAIAIAANPKLIVADEPTSALDVTVQRVILDQLEELAKESGTAVLLVTHDLGVAGDRAQRVVVMSQGRVVEAGPTADVLRDPKDPYTRTLLAAAPSLAVAQPRLAASAARERTVVRDRSAGPAATSPAQTAPSVSPLVTVSHISKHFALPSVGKQGRQVVTAVDDVSFTLGRGRTLALVGESGSGKSTTARLVLRLADATAGTITFDGTDVTRVRGAQLRGLRRRAQLIYQNPYASLDPRQTVGEIVGEPLRVHGIGDRGSRLDRTRDLLARVALPSSTLLRRPAELSGGQRQRVAIARALALAPDLVVCDEPVSALDVSVQAQVLDLLAELQADTGVAYLFISHDLAVVRSIAHDVAVMRSGRIVEIDTAERLFDDPTTGLHPGVARRHPRPKYRDACPPDRPARPSVSSEQKETR